MVCWCLSTLNCKGVYANWWVWLCLCCYGYHKAGTIKREAWVHVWSGAEVISEMWTSQTRDLILLHRKTNKYTLSQSWHSLVCVQSLCTISNWAETLQCLIWRASGRRLCTLMFTAAGWSGPIYAQKSCIKPAKSVTVAFNIVC